jgi:hypothetical protein
MLYVNMAFSVGYVMTMTTTKAIGSTISFDLLGSAGGTSMHQF